MALAVLCPKQKFISTPFIILYKRISYQSLLAEGSPLEASFQRRGLAPTCIKSLRETWETWHSVAQRFAALEARREALSDQTQNVMTQSSNLLPPSSAAPSELTRLKEEGKKLRQELKTVNKEYHEAVKAASATCFSLPNLVHEKTPDSSLVVHVHGQRPWRPHELDFALLSVKFIAPGLFFTKGAWGRLELKLSRHLLTSLATEGFQALSAPDFVLDAIAESCSPFFREPRNVFALQTKHKAGRVNEPGLCLVGGASVPAQAALFAKTVLASNSLAKQVRFCSLGRSYSPLERNVGERSELEGSGGVKEGKRGEMLQTNNVQLVVAGHEDVFQECETNEKRLIKLYDQLGLHYRVRYVGARELGPFEQFKSVWEVFAPQRGRFVEVGCLSYMGDYFSQRLLCKSDAQQPLYMLLGTAMDVSQLISCLMEYHSEAKVAELLNRF